jgi:SOS-response transcriptional repressor LexA
VGETGVSKDRIHFNAGLFRQALDALNPFDYRGCVVHAPHYLQECNACQEGMQRAQRILMRHLSGMEEAQEDARAFVRAALEKTGWSLARLAKEAGVAPSTLSRPLNKADHKFILKAATLKKVAEAAGMPLPGPLASIEEPPFPVEARVPVVGEVQAGVFTRISDEEVASEWLPFEMPEYRGAKLFALKVRGRSMDIDYPDGSYVVCAPVAETGVLEGDDVIVRVHAPGGVETTIKEVRRGDNGQVLLCPRSSDQSFEPIPFTPNPDEAAQMGVEIVGIVIVGWKRRPRGTGRMIRID